MTQSIVVVGSGFAGMWAALAAARLRDLAPDPARAIDIVVVSPRPVLVIRPRLYEATLDGMEPDLAALLETVGVRHLAGTVERLDVAGGAVDGRDAHGRPFRQQWDRLVLAAGSGLYAPPIPGLATHAFNVDQIDDARRLETHLRSLAGLPDSAARNTVVVAGGGFTGIETAAEMPARLRRSLGTGCTTRTVLVERESAVGPDLGPGPRPVIEQALRSLAVEVVTGAGVKAIGPDSIELANGQRIETHTVVWTAGARAHPLAAQIDAPRDAFGRLHVDADLRVPAAPTVFATGDVARAATDDDGHAALMSCQHAIALGRAAGHNAMAELLGQATRPYRQPKYVTCLDLGGWGAVYTEGWERTIHLQGAEAKALKIAINTGLIYPPKGTRAEILATADPAIPVVA